jgi:hypothetical protein
LAEANGNEVFTLIFDRANKFLKKVFHQKIGLNGLNLFFGIKWLLLIKNNDLGLFN